MSCFNKCCQKINKKYLCFCATLIFYLLWFLITDSAFEAPQFYSRAIVDRLNCACRFNRSAPLITSAEWNSTCSDWSTVRGPGQRVVAYSIFGNDSDYFDGIVQNAELVREHYPGWVMRLYYHFEWTEQEERAKLCPIWCQFHHLDLCAVDHLPAPLYNQSDLQPRMWRFLVLGDGTVDVFVSRDVDSLPTVREVAAVDQWLKSGKTFHFMHDHYYHTVPVLAGMWGALNTNLSLTTHLREEFLVKGKTKQYGFQDQDLLASVLLPIAELTEDYVDHNSYRCNTSSPKHSRPWPTRRNNSLDYVGRPVTRHKLLALGEACPAQCRPPRHPDWDYC